MQPFFLSKHSIVFEFLTKLSFSKGVQIALIIFGNIIAPYWFLYQFFRAMVTENNLIQQLILCLAIATPITLLGFSFAVWISSRKIKSIPQHDKDLKINEDENTQRLREAGESKLIFEWLSEGSISTAMMFYGVCVLSYFFPINSNISIYMCIAGYGGIIISKTARGFSYKKKKK